MKNIVFTETIPTASEKDAVEELPILYSIVNDTTVGIVDKCFMVVTYDFPSGGTYNILGNRSDTSKYVHMDDYIIEMYVDGSETPETPSLTYTFDEGGIHKIKFIFKHETLSFEFLLTNTTSYVTHVDMKRMDGEATTMKCMFDRCANLKRVSGFESLINCKPTSLQQMFYKDENLESINLSELDTSNVTSMAYAFQECKKVKFLGSLNKWDVSKVTSFYSTFLYTMQLRTLGDISGWDVSNATNMCQMFCVSKALKDVSPYLKSWGSKVAKVENLAYTFSNYGSWMYDPLTKTFEEGYTQKDYDEITIDTLDLSGWNTSSLTNIRSLFTYAGPIKKINLSGWNLTNVTTAGSIFTNSDVLEEIDLSGWEYTGAASRNGMEIYNLPSLKKIYVRGCSDATIAYLRTQVGGTTPSDVEFITS